MRKPKGRSVALAATVLGLATIVAAAGLGWPQFRFRWLFEPLGRNAQGLMEYRHRQTGIVMVALPGGKFWMGAQKTDPKGPNYDPESNPNEGPVHQVTLSPYLIGKYEVTQAEWKVVMGSNPSEFTGDDSRPIEQVSWEDIRRFDARTGLLLPTEAGWEYACRGGSTEPIAGTGKLDEMGWYGGNSGRTTHLVGKKAANGFGLHDLHGNVWEWCEDGYIEGFYRKPEASGTDPIALSVSAGRVFRGGSWGYDTSRCRSSFRFGAARQEHVANLGFRVAWRGP